MLKRLVPVPIEDERVWHSTHWSVAPNFRQRGRGVPSLMRISEHLRARDRSRCQRDREKAELDIDLSEHWSKGIEDFEHQPPMDLVVTVCDEAAEACPFFPNARRQEHWGFPDPSRVTGSEEDRLNAYRHIRDLIAVRINQFLDLHPSRSLEQLVIGVD